MKIILDLLADTNRGPEVKLEISVNGTYIELKINDSARVISVSKTELQKALNALTY